MRLNCVNRSPAWTAEVEVNFDTRRVAGSLHRSQVVLRESFNVKLADDNTFQVDIGTGSGVKVKFKIG